MAVGGVEPASVMVTSPTASIPAGSVRCTVDSAAVCVKSIGRIGRPG
ncbi:MAG: hypothetical protein R2911_01385 [Caldilineaceae bacterium]